jgi:hypothetical protein
MVIAAGLQVDLGFAGSVVAPSASPAPGELDLCKLVHIYISTSSSIPAA